MIKKLNKRLIYTLIILVALLGAGTLYYSVAEGWSHIDSFYFSTTTLTTIGFGDLVPTTPGSKIFTSVYALMGIGVMLYILSSVIGGFIFRQERHFERIFFHDKKIKKQETTIKKRVRNIERQEKRIKEQERKLKKQEKRVNP